MTTIRIALNCGAPDCPTCKGGYATPVDQLAAETIMGLSWDKGALEAELERSRQKFDEQTHFYEKICANASYHRDYYRYQWIKEQGRSWWDKLWNRNP